MMVMSVLWLLTVIVAYISGYISGYSGGKSQCVCAAVPDPKCCPCAAPTTI